MKKEEENFLQLIFSNDKQNLELAKQLAQGNEKLNKILKKTKQAYTHFFGSQDFNKSELNIDEWFDWNQRTIKHLTRLRSLKKLIIHNLPKEVLHPDIGNLQNLTLLSANGCSISKIPKSISRLINLKDLSV